MSNFFFLKSVDKNLYNIISEAEKLYRDEYFEQSITQTRRFGEIVCKNVLGDSRTTEKTFDDMLATLKDKVSTVIQEKEFVEDLYFLKREGNASVHAKEVKKDGIIALECLQRAFEVALSYVVYYKKQNSNFLKLQFDIDLLVTGKKSKKTLSKKYQQEKDKSVKKAKSIKKTKKKIVSSEKNKVSVFSVLLSVASFISLLLIMIIFILTFIDG